MIDVEKILVRCHRIGDIMSDGRSVITDKQLALIDTLSTKMGRTQKQEEELQRLIYKRDHPELSSTAKSYCEQLLIEERTGRHKMISSKYLEKGLRQENDSITLLSLAKGVFLKKNSERLSNRFITGEPDVYIGESIKKTKLGYDLKTAWDVFTMPYFKRVDPQHEWQAQGYCALTGADQWIIAYALVNAPSSMIQREKERIFYSLGSPDESDAEYMRQKVEIEKNMIFDMEQFKKDNPFYDLDCKEWVYDIPMDERIIEFPVMRDNEAINAMYEKVKECRSWISETLLK